MTRWALFTILLLSAAPALRASGDGETHLSASEQEGDQPNSGDEGEEKGIIPPGASVEIDSETLTPISPYTESKAYDQALQELAQAQALWDKGELEAASDTALEAYDDLNGIHRRRKKERRKLYGERHQAATVYVQAGVRTIQEFVNKNGRTTAAVTEGRGRLEDLRDVARNYPELNAALNKAGEQLTR